MYTVKRINNSFFKNRKQTQVYIKIKMNLNKQWKEGVSLDYLWIILGLSLDYPGLSFDYPWIIWLRIMFTVALCKHDNEPTDSITAWSIFKTAQHSTHHTPYTFLETTNWLTLGYHRCKGKGKAIILQAWTSPEGFRRLRLPDFKTIGTWKWLSVLRTGRL